MFKKMILIDDDGAVVEELAAGLNVSLLAAKVLAHRGVNDIESAKNFLNPAEQPWLDPFLMLGMSEAVRRINQAIENHEKIVIYGDYDVDGMVATSLLIRALKRLNADVGFYIPTRAEGYGLNLPALQRIADSGASLLITVDCGITNGAVIDNIAGRLDVIVTDHHLPSEPITSAVAVLDPHQVGCNYPDKSLCGAGVAFKLCQALNSNPEADLDIVALATVADIVPLTGENRKIVYLGLKLMTQTHNVGLQALIKVAGLSGKALNTNHLGFSLGPRLNATGRLSSAASGVQLLTTSDSNLADDIAKALDDSNSKRKEMENLIVDEATQKYNELRRIHGGDLSSIVVASEGWHPGVIGLAASRLLEQHYLPTIVLSIQGEFSVASCRSIAALHMKDALDHFSHFFTQYGGHAAAAGFTIHTKDLATFAAQFDDYVKNKVNDEDFVPSQFVDAFIHPSEMTLPLADELEKIAPFGVSNPRPLFAAQNLSATSPKIMGPEKNHLSFFIKGIEDNPDIRAVAWGGAALAPLIENELIDLTFAPERNDFNGSATVQCMVKSLVPSKTTHPDRAAMVNFYKFLKLNSSETDFRPFDICSLNAKFKSSSFANDSNSTYTMLCAVQVFEELGLLQFNPAGDSFIMPPTNRMLNLNESRTWR